MFTSLFLLLWFVKKKKKKDLVWHDKKKKMLTLGPLWWSTDVHIPDPGDPQRPCAHCWRCVPRKNPEGSWESNPVGTTGYLKRRQPHEKPDLRSVKSLNKIFILFYHFHLQHRLMSSQQTPASTFVWLERGCGTNSLL